MPDIEWNKTFWSSYHWPSDGEEWSCEWGDARTQWFGTILPRIGTALPARRIVEIAPGRGRWTRFLLQHCRSYAGYDLSPPCVEHCNALFVPWKRWFANIRFYETDGLSLRQERNNSVDFVFSFDSLVHAESNVLTAYVRECARILRPGGLAFLHHSNLAARELPKDDYYHFRGPSTSAETVAEDCSEIGLLVLVQEIVSWAGIDALDCFSLIAKPPIPSFHQTTRVDNPGFWGDVGRLRRNIGPYLMGGA